MEATPPPCRTAGASRRYLQRAAAFTSLGDADRATADYNTAIQLDPRAVPAFLQRGCLHAAKAGDYTAAVTVCRMVAAGSSFFCRGCLQHLQLTRLSAAACVVGVMYQMKLRNET